MKFWKVILGCLLVGCAAKQAPKAPAVPVRVMTITAKTIPQNFEFVGVAESSHIVELRARVEGYLEEINYTEGGLVQEGDLMFVLDQRPFMATLNEAKGELARQEAVLWNATQQRNRMEPLYKENAVSQKDLDDAIANELSARASYESAQANVEKAALNLSFCSIQSPVTGMATKAIYREGALISPGTHSLLTNIYVVDPIWVNFSVSQGDILRARIEEEKGLLVLPAKKKFDIEIQMPNGTVLAATGHINFTAPDLQQSTGTMLVRSTVSNKQGWLKPGQFVKVLIKGATRPNAITVPQQAVLQGEKGLFVYVVDAKGYVSAQPVETGPWFGQDWVIFKGLQAGDTVVVEGVNKLQNGSRVCPLPLNLEDKAFVYDISLFH